ncbi:MAG TPA: TetR/AcrR family transcriptional regulator [Myxococcales bacterium]|nr:TetR/AcrR family transcriptional regulator [Myxococcales bacterium]
MTSPDAAEEAKPRIRLPGVRPPKPLLPLEIERRLTNRQRELLDELESLVVGEGLADVTMAQIAARVNCSLRTLYGISPSKDELVLTVTDRRLHRIGRAAIASLDPSLPPLEALRAYLAAANEAVRDEQGEMVRTLVELPGAKRLFDTHENYLTGIVQSLLDRAVEQGDIAPLDTAAVAHVLAGLGQEFSRSSVHPVIEKTPKQTADDLTEIILRGLKRS